MANPDPRMALAALVQERGDSYAALSRLIGRNVTYLQQFVTKGSPRALSERDRRLLARYFGVSESVLGGTEAMEPELASVPRLDVAAAAGAGALTEDERTLRLTRMDRALLRALGVRPQSASFIRVVGDSMLPTLAPGDEILVDTADRALGKRPALFVLRHEGALLVKRVSVNGARATIRSDNPDYPAIETDLDAIEAVGRVVWLGRVLRAG